MVVELLTAWGVKAAWSAFSPVLEDLAKDVAKDAAKSYVGKCFGRVFSPKNEKVLIEGTGRAVKELLKQLEDELLDADMEIRELENMRGAVADFLKQEPVRETIASLLKEPHLLDPAVLAQADQQTLQPQGRGNPRQHPGAESNLCAKKGH